MPARRAGADLARHLRSVCRQDDRQLSGAPGGAGVTLGIGLPNRPLLPDDLERMQACGFTDYLDLWLDDQQWPDRWEAVAKLGRLHIRVGVWGPLDAASDANRLIWLARRYPWGVSWRIRNEPNLEADGADPATWYQYLIDLADLLPPDVRAKVWVPAISPSGVYLSWLDASVRGAEDGGFAGLDCHVYGTAENVTDGLWLLRERWTGPLMVTEQNPGAGRIWLESEWADSLPSVLRVCTREKVDACILFSWEWHNPDPPPVTSVDVRGSAVEQYLRNLTQPAGEGMPSIDVGPGLARVEPLIGPFDVSEEWKWPGTDRETSIIATARGFACWRRATNEVVVVVDEGQAIFRDFGNRGTGVLKKVHGL